MNLTAEITVSISAIGPIKDNFDEPRIKIGQAKRHIHRLEVMQDDHFMTDWYSYEFSPSSKGKRAELSVVAQLPGNEFGAVMDDIIHNCRASLDILACLLVRLNDETDNKVNFPFSNSAQELDSMITHKNFNRASNASVDTLKKLKPYKGGNLILRAIHDLDIYDKHRALIPAAGNITTPEVKAEVIDGETFITHVVESKPKMRLIFPENGPLGKQEIIPALKECIRHTEEIIKMFEEMNT